MKAKTKTNRKSNEKQKPQKKANGPARRSERNGKSNKGAPSKGPWRAPEAAVCAKCASSIQSQAWARACANRPKQGRNKTSIPPPGAVDAARSSPRRRNKEAGRSDPQPTGRGAEPAPAFGPPGAESVRKAHWVGLRRAGSRPACARFLPPTRGRLGLRSAVRKPGRSIGVFAPVGAGRFVGMGLGQASLCVFAQSGESVVAQRSPAFGESKRNPSQPGCAQSAPKADAGDWLRRRAFESGRCARTAPGRRTRRRFGVRPVRPIGV